MNIAQYCTQAIQWILPNPVHMIFNEYCPILYTSCSMNIAQYCPQAVQWILPNTVHRLSLDITQYCAQALHWILPNTVHRLLISYSPRLSKAYSAVLITGYWVFSGLQIKSKFILRVRYTVQPFHIKLRVINIVQYYWCLRIPLTLCEYAPHLWTSKSSVCKFVFTVAFTFFSPILEGKLKDPDKFLLICP